MPGAHSIRRPPPTPDVGSQRQADAPLDVDDYL
jgi:hypothetical protein